MKSGGSSAISKVMRSAHNGRIGKFNPAMYAPRSRLSSAPSINHTPTEMAIITKNCKKQILKKAYFGADQMNLKKLNAYSAKNKLTKITGCVLRREGLPVALYQPHPVGYRKSLKIQKDRNFIR